MTSRFEPDAVERPGDREATRVAYARLLDLWDRADGPLQSILADSRARRAARAEEVESD